MAKRFEFAGVLLVQRRALCGNFCPAHGRHIHMADTNAASQMEDTPGAGAGVLTQLKVVGAVENQQPLPPMSEEMKKKIAALPHARQADAGGPVQHHARSRNDAADSGVPAMHGEGVLKYLVGTPDHPLGKRIMAGDVAPAAAPWISTLCFSQTKGNPLTGQYATSGSQWLIGRKLETCDKDKLANGSQLELTKAWGGKLLTGEDIYACVSKEKPRRVISGLTKYSEDDTKLLECGRNGGLKKPKKISLSPNGRLVWNWSHTHDHEHGRQNQHGQHTHDGASTASLEQPPASR